MSKKDAKKEILEKIQHELGRSSVGIKSYDHVPRAYRRQSDKSRDEITAEFIERVNEYKAVVKKADSDTIHKILAASCKERGARKVVIPYGFPKQWLPEEIEIEVEIDKEGAWLTKQQIDDADVAITGCAVAVAQTGTICLNAREGQGRRILTLVPDFHICIVRENQIVELLPEAISQLQPDVQDDQLPITLISGPSATSDIELSRVEGVHGPRKLTVVVMN